MTLHELLNSVPGDINKLAIMALVTEWEETPYKQALYGTKPCAVLANLKESMESGNWDIDV